MSTRRLFFAFWPDATPRRALDLARNRLFPRSGRPVDPASLHVTDGFPQRLAKDTEDCPIFTASRRIPKAGFR